MAQGTPGSAGRGVLSLTGAKLYFIVAGYTVQLTLPRLLGSPEAFGLYSSAMSVVSILNNVLITATIQTVSKRVSERLDQAGATLRQGLKLQLIVAITVAGALLLLAPTLAQQVLLDPLLAPLFRIAAAVVFSYALYAALVGSLNGRQMFQHQAGLDMSYTTLRTAGILGAAALGFGVLGAIAGFASAAVCVLLLALLVVRTGERGEQLPWRTWIAFMAPLWLYQLCLNLILQVDLSVLKRTVAELSIQAGQAPAAAAEVASRFAGFYRAAQTFSFVPYQLILAVTFVVFPMISQTVSLGDEDATRRYIRAATRFSLIVLLAIAAPISGASAGVMNLAYPAEYLAGSGALSVLSLGMVNFAMFVIGATILSGAGHPARAAAIAITAVGLVVGCNLLFVRSVGVGDDTLMAAAAGTSVGTTFALLIVGVAVHRRFGAFVAAASVARVAAAATVAFAVARAMPSGTALLALAALIVGGLSYLAALFTVRELGRQDLDAVLGVLKR